MSSQIGQASLAGPLETGRAGRVQSTHTDETGALAPPKMAAKRKREVTDQEGSSGRTTATMGGRRPSFKKGSSQHDDMTSNGANTEEQSATAYLTGQTGSGSGDGELHDNADTLDFSTLSHHHDVSDQSNGSHHAANASSTAAAALAGIYPSMTIPQPTDLSFASTHTGADSSYSVSDHTGGHGQSGDSTYGLSALQEGGQGLREDSSGIGQRPAVGSDEWHKQRRDNHKEVERRRRETINEGINELAKIVPGCEKNKGSILQRAVQFITQLKDNESQNIEKWTLEKLLTEQAIAELSSSVDKLKNDCERAWREAEKWKKLAQSAGVSDKEEPTKGENEGATES